MKVEKGAVAAVDVEDRAIVPGHLDDIDLDEKKK